MALPHLALEPVDGTRALHGLEGFLEVHPHSSTYHQKGPNVSCLSMLVFFSSPAVIFDTFKIPLAPPLCFKRCLVVILRVRFGMWRNMRNRSTIPALFAHMVTLHPEKPALIYEATGEVKAHQILQIKVFFSFIIEM